MRYVCSICGYIYDEDKMGAAFSALPADWHCPLCGAGKDAFRPEQPVTVSAPAPEALPDEDMQQLSAGQLAALFSNLARGCEKQYKDEEAALFRQIADWYTAAVPAVPNANTDALFAQVQEDISAGYPRLTAVGQAQGDRGALRVTVWGEKVTRMLSSLLQRYLREGEAFLENTQVWVCTVCGFVYVGDTAPELCPVCKVPAWKFEKMEGRVSA